MHSDREIEMDKLWIQNNKSLSLTHSLTDPLKSLSPFFFGKVYKEKGTQRPAYKKNSEQVLLSIIAPTQRESHYV